uniref:Uncharacterized protein n=1 Tax=Avena sativa TaxID=4498 RepID=A0ACD5UI08_AVESA
MAATAALFISSKLVYWLILHLHFFKYSGSYSQNHGNFFRSICSLFSRSLCSHSHTLRNRLRLKEDCTNILRLRTGSHRSRYDEHLVYFYGEDITRDGPSGLDLSRCETKNVIVKELVNASFMDIRRRIRAEFGPEMARKKMIVQAVVCKRVGEDYRWALRQVKGENSWGLYIKFASTPGAAMYGQLMVYVPFVDASDIPGSSTTVGEIQLSIAAMAIDSETVERRYVEDSFVPSHNNGPYSMAIVDLNEWIEGQSDELDSGDDDRESSDDDEDEGGGPSQVRAVAPAMAPGDIEALVIGHDDTSVRGVGATILEENQQFPSKEAVDMAIRRYAFSISREHKVKKSDKHLLKVLCIESGCPGRVVARQHASLGR